MAGLTLGPTIYLDAMDRHPTFRPLSGDESDEEPFYHELGHAFDLGRADGAGAMPQWVRERPDHHSRRDAVVRG
jgi:hypothetical protein